MSKSMTQGFDFYSHMLWAWCWLGTVDFLTTMSGGDLPDRDEVRSMMAGLDFDEVFLERDKVVKKGCESHGQNQSSGI